MRKYIIINVNELNKVDFDLVMQNIDTLIYYELNNEIYTILKWEGENPYFLDNVEYQGILSETEVLETLQNYNEI